MKSISPQTYARAFVEALDHSPAHHTQIIKNFIEEVRRNGHWPRRHQIAAECERAWRQRHNQPLLVVESARALNAAQKAHLEKSLGKKHDIEERVRPELIAGVRLTLDDEMQLDHSLAHLLNEVFA